MTSGAVKAHAEEQPRHFHCWLFGVTNEEVDWPVERRDTWPQQLEGLLLDRVESVSVSNAGVPGYSSRQIRQTIERLLPVLHPQLVVVGLYASSYWRTENPYVLFGGTLVSRDELPRLTVLPGATTAGAAEIFYSPYDSRRLVAVEIGY